MELVVINPVHRHVVSCVKFNDGSGHVKVDTKLSGDASELKKKYSRCQY